MTRLVGILVVAVALALPLAVRAEQDAAKAKTINAMGTVSAVTVDSLTRLNLYTGGGLRKSARAPFFHKGAGAAVLHSRPADAIDPEVFVGLGPGDKPLRSS